MAAALASATGKITAQKTQDLKEIARHLSSGDAVEKRTARRRLNGYNRDEITDFLEREWVALENQRRRNKRILIRLTLAAGSIAFATLIVVFCFWNQTGRMLGRWNASLLLNMTVPVTQILLLLAKIVINIDERLRSGLRTILIEYADVRQVPALIDALADGVNRRQVEGNIALFLPEYHRHDLPPLDDTQRKRLLAELKDAPERIKARKETGLTDEDVAYLSALLGYWERESQSPAPLPKNTAKAITVVTRPLKSADEPTRDRWHRVQETAKDCLLRVQGASSG